MAGKIVDFDANKLRWCDAHSGFRQKGLVFETIAPAKMGPGQEIAPAYVVRAGPKLMLLKVRYSRNRKVRLQTVFGRGGLYHEIVMLKKASESGLPVAEPIAFTAPSWRNFLASHALLLTWIPDSVRLREWVVETVKNGDRRHLDVVETKVATLFHQIRNSGLGDSDFGAHNLMFRDESPASENLVWIDLERAREACPSDPMATNDMVCSLLAGWWVITEGDQYRIQALLNAIKDAGPEPSGGWSVIADSLNHSVQKLVTSHKRAGRIDCFPQTLRL